MSANENDTKEKIASFRKQFERLRKEYTKEQLQKECKKDISNLTKEKHYCDAAYRQLQYTGFTNDWLEDPEESAEQAKAFAEEMANARSRKRQCDLYYKGGEGFIKHYHIMNEVLATHKFGTKEGSDMAWKEYQLLNKMSSQLMKCGQGYTPTFFERITGGGAEKKEKFFRLSKLAHEVGGNVNEFRNAHNQCMWKTPNVAKEGAIGCLVRDQKRTLERMIKNFDEFEIGTGKQKQRPRPGS